MIRIPKKIIEEMIAHAKREYPKECCGLLAGNNLTVKDFYPMTNTDQSQFTYLMNPKEQFTVFKEMRRRGTELLAIYHSHPKTKSEPSATDVNLAFYPDAYYIIIPLSDPTRPEVRAFKIVDSKSSKEEVIII